MRLVCTGHLNAIERSELDPPAVRFSEVVAAIDQLLQTTRYFPPGAAPEATSVSNGIDERGMIERLEGGTFRVHWQRPYAWNPTRRAEYTTEDFTTLPAAVGELARWEWRTGINGVPISTG